MIKFENPKNGRYYYIAVQNDLISTPILIVYRGGNQKKLVKNYSFKSVSDLQSRLNLMINRRLARGYIQV